MLGQLIVRCYSYQIKKQFHHPMNGVLDVTVNVSAARVDRVRRLFFSDESLSKHQS